MDSKPDYPFNQIVRLAPLVDEHISRYMQLSNDPELVLTMGWQPFDSKDKERFLKTIAVSTLPYNGAGQPSMFSIISVAENKPIGYVCLKGINENTTSVELGIGIMEKEYRSQGYGTEALRLVTRYAFDKLGLSLIGLTVFLFNKRAIKAYEKAGFSKRKVLKKSWLLTSGEYIDMLLMELARESGDMLRQK